MILQEHRGCINITLSSPAEGLAMIEAITAAMRSPGGYTQDKQFVAATMVTPAQSYGSGIRIHMDRK